MSSRFGSRPSGVTFAMLGLMLSLSRPVGAQPGTAPNGDPGGFGIDGDLGSNSPTAGISDWAPEAGGTGVALIFSNGTPATSFTVHGGTQTPLLQSPLQQSASPVHALPFCAHGVAHVPASQ